MILSYQILQCTTHNFMHKMSKVRDLRVARDLRLAKMLVIILIQLKKFYELRMLFKTIII